MGEPGVWKGWEGRDCGWSQVDQGGEVSKDAGSGPVGAERSLDFILSVMRGLRRGMWPDGDSQ